MTFNNIKELSFEIYSMLHNVFNNSDVEEHKLSLFDKVYDVVFTIKAKNNKDAMQEANIELGLFNSGNIVRRCHVFIPKFNTFNVSPSVYLNIYDYFINMFYTLVIDQNFDISQNNPNNFIRLGVDKDVEKIGQFKYINEIIEVRDVLPILKTEFEIFKDFTIFEFCNFGRFDYDMKNFLNNLTHISFKYNGSIEELIDEIDDAIYNPQLYGYYYNKTDKTVFIFQKFAVADLIIEEINNIVIDKEFVFRAKINAGIIQGIKENDDLSVWDSSFHGYLSANDKTNLVYDYKYFDSVTGSFSNDLLKYKGRI